MKGYENIAIIGAGLMGHGIAQVFASAGHEVRLTDVSRDVLEKAPQNIRANLTLLAENGIGRKEEIETVMGRVKVSDSLDEAVSCAVMVIEAVIERLDIKQGLFRNLDSLCPSEVILATNTSVISITEIAAKTGVRKRVVGTHFWNPPYLIPLVEVVPGAETSPDIVDATYRLLESVGKRPVKVKRDVPGFVGNRLQHALWREAISIVDQGIADAATVDEVIKNSFGIRLPVLGPMATADMVGLDLTFQIHDYILKHLDRSVEPAPILRRKAEAGELGFKTGKGFQEWDEKGMQECRAGLLKHLIRWTKENRMPDK